MVALIKNADQTYTLTYFGKDVGYISRVRYLKTKERAFRGISVHGDVRYASSLKSIRNLLLAAYH